MEEEAVEEMVEKQEEIKRDKFILYEKAKIERVK